MSILSLNLLDPIDVGIQFQCHQYNINDSAIPSNIVSMSFN